MKNVILAGFVLVSVVIGFVAYSSMGATKNNIDFLRIHIRANSNLEIDQDVKYLVKDKVIDSLTPLFANINTREQAINAIKNNLKYVENIANAVLLENNFTYGVKARVANEYFPTRVYNDVSLAQGFYDALILELGQGAGDNWWCVVYPPLCFLDNNIGGASGVLYRSKLQEIINKIL
ncbi:MAG: stage II sporulation protein R [Firmicutes bacterium]|nr:stage II sporulation protein R [Bacillota bacterium]